MIGKPVQYHYESEGQLATCAAQITFVVNVNVVHLATNAWDSGPGQAFNVAKAEVPTAGCYTDLPTE